MTTPILTRGTLAGVPSVRIDTCPPLFARDSLRHTLIDIHKTLHARELGRTGARERIESVSADALVVARTGNTFISFLQRVSTCYVYLKKLACT